MEAILRKEVMLNKDICRVFAILSAIILISLGAYVRVFLPFTPVPFTMQTFFILLSAALLSRKLSLLSQISYILLGVLGLPIFAGVNFGISYFLSPTAGYLLGFMLATVFITFNMKYIRLNAVLTMAIFSVASIIILSCGTMWLKISLGIPLDKALLIGFLPFIPGDLLKVITATFIYLKLKPRLEQVL